MALIADRVGKLAKHLATLRPPSHLWAKVSVDTRSAWHCGEGSSQTLGGAALRRTPLTPPPAHAPAYLDVGQELLLPPPDVLQFLPLLCGQVAGDCGDRGHVRRWDSEATEAPREGGLGHRAPPC